MADVVLVVLRRPEMALNLLHAAQRMATLMGGARINVLAIQEPLQISALAAEALIQEADAVVQAKYRERQRVASLSEHFKAWIGTAGADASWMGATGNPADVVSERGRRADLVVAGQPSQGDRLARQMFSAAVFSTDRPVLIVPPAGRAIFGRRVAIAWRDDKQAIKALIPALRFLSSAEEVHVLAGVRAGAPAPQMPRVLLEHGVSAKLHVLQIGSSPFGQTLLETVGRLSADLLVMGAFAHSWLRETILGGMTTYMLDHADLPVLLRH